MSDSFLVLCVWQLAVLGTSLATIVFVGWIAATVARSDISPERLSWWTGGSALGFASTFALGLIGCYVAHWWVDVYRSSGYYWSYGLPYLGEMWYAFYFTHIFLVLLSGYVVVRYAAKICAVTRRIDRKSKT